MSGSGILEGWFSDKDRILLLILLSMEISSIMRWCIFAKSVYLSKPEATITPFSALYE